MTRLYLGNAFGWDTEATAKVAIAQLRAERMISVDKCPQAQLIKNESIRWHPNILKILGYIPVLNLIAGIVAIANAESSHEYGPNHTALWRGRGVAMILSGPLLLIVDLIVHLYHLRIVNRYNSDHPNLIEAFNTTHAHTPAAWAGHPVFCCLEGKAPFY